MILEKKRLPLSRKIYDVIFWVADVDIMLWFYYFNWIIMSESIFNVFARTPVLHWGELQTAHLRMK